MICITHERTGFQKTQSTERYANSTWCADRLPGMLLLRCRSLLSKGLDHSLLLVVDSDGLPTPQVALYFGTAYLVVAFLTSVLLDTLLCSPISDNW